MEWKRIGYGTWPLAGNVSGSVSYGKTDDGVSMMALREAFDWGINVYDTSDLYGFGHVERLMGEVFDGYRQDIVIITKGGMINLNDDQNFDVGYLESALSKSLKRLRTDYIDVYMLHNPPPSVFCDDNVKKFLCHNLQSGRIKEWGVSLKTPEDGLDIVNQEGLSAIEVNYNILDRRAEFSGLLDVCQSKGIKVIARTPLSQGILSGQFSMTDDVSDRRNRLSKSYIEKSTKSYKKMLMGLNDNRYTDAQNCLRFCLYHPAISVTIPGMKTMEQVIDNVFAIHASPLTGEEIQRVTRIYKEENL
jgi:aryl-alcohol dehydrogenase-like predicted oxidoreductase